MQMLGAGRLSRPTISFAFSSRKRQKLPKWGRVEPGANVMDFDDTDFDLTVDEKLSKASTGEAKDEDSLEKMFSKKDREFDPERLAMKKG